MRLRYRRETRREVIEKARRRRSGPSIVPSIAIKGRGRVAQLDIPMDELEAQAKRLAAYAARDLTARVFNDPPVGMSALDEREG